MTQTQTEIETDRNTGRVRAGGRMQGVIDRKLPLTERSHRGSGKHVRDSEGYIRGTMLCKQHSSQGQRQYIATMPVKPTRSETV